MSAAFSSVGVWLMALLEADPVTVSAGLAAYAVLLYLLIRRRGGLDPGSIIRVFSTLATAATLPKLALWLGYSIAGGKNPQPAPGHTDLLLGLGGLTAILFVLLEDLGAVASTGDGAGLSRWERGRQLLLGATPSALKAWWIGVSTASAPEIEETDVAKRESLEQNGPGQKP